MGAYKVPRRRSKLFTDTTSLNPTQTPKRSLGPREGKEPSYGHVRREGQSQAVNPSDGILELRLLRQVRDCRKSIKRLIFPNTFSGHFGGDRGVHGGARIGWHERAIWYG